MSAMAIAEKLKSDQTSEQGNDGNQLNLFAL